MHQDLTFFEGLYLLDYKTIPLLEASVVNHDKFADRMAPCRRQII